MIWVGSLAVITASKVKMEIPSASWLAAKLAIGELQVQLRDPASKTNKQ